jgi:hypothetical protein
MKFHACRNQNTMSDDSFVQFFQGGGPVEEVLLMVFVECRLIYTRMRASGGCGAMKQMKQKRQSSVDTCRDASLAYSYCTLLCCATVLCRNDSQYIQVSLSIVVVELLFDVQCPCPGARTDGWMDGWTDVRTSAR